MSEITARLDVVADAIQDQLPHMALALDCISDRLESRTAEDNFPAAYGHLKGVILANLEKGRISLIKAHVERLKDKLPKEHLFELKPIFMLLASLEKSFDEGLKKAEASLKTTRADSYAS